MSLPGLGVSASDIKVLGDSVSIVFHSAATVKFDEALKSAVEMNLKGTMRLIELCRKMERLEVCFFANYSLYHISPLCNVFLNHPTGSDPRVYSVR